MTKDIAQSIKAKVLNIAKSEGQNYQQLIIRYLYERLLYRLSVSEYKDKFCLKGGALLYAFEKDFPRPTLDIDFLGIKIQNDIETIKSVFREILAIPYDDGIQFDISTIDAEDISENNAYHGIRVIFTAHLDSIKQPMRMDIGFSDVIIPTAQNLTYPVLMEGLPAPEILAYSLESVVAEKFQAMIELSEVNSCYKDFYDVYKILSVQQPDDAVLTEAVQATFSNRETPYLENHPLFTESFVKDENRNMQWKRFLKKIKQDEVLDFEDVMKLIISKLYPIYETLNANKE
jgi:predicted nucleotidyltransferase component of viral defense system